MIENIDFFVKKELLNKFSYIEKLPFFQKHKSLSFKPGVNVLFGQNGTGKSTILSMLAISLAGKQGGISKITNHWMQDNSKDGFEVSHDGQAILYCDTKTDVGLVGGLAAFDYDFHTAGINAAIRKASSGLTTLSRLEPIMDVLLKDKPMPKNIEGNKKHIVGKIKKGQRTILIDEPESGLSYILQSKFMPKIIEGAKRNNIQLIMASHSPFLLGYDNEDVNLIEMEDDFVMNSRLAILSLKSVEKQLFKSLGCSDEEANAIMKK